MACKTSRGNLQLRFQLSIPFHALWSCSPFNGNSYGHTAFSATAIGAFGSEMAIPWTFQSVILQVFQFGITHLAEDSHPDIRHLRITRNSSPGVLVMNNHPAIPNIDVEKPWKNPLFPRDNDLHCGKLPHLTVSLALFVSSAPLHVAGPCRRTCAFFSYRPAAGKQWLVGRSSRRNWRKRFRCTPIWLVVGPPLWKIWVSQLGWLETQY